MDLVLEKLKFGARKFRSEIYSKNAESYQRAAAQPQRPHALIVACADSRVDVETITCSQPGDIFVSRNIGNMVPAYGHVLGGVSSVIEYAVTALKVQHVVICGHSDCGAMKALLKPESTGEMPTVRTWLDNGASALRVAEIVHEEQGRDLLSVLTEQNVLMQLTHLRTHPSIAGAMAKRELTISGWVYDIGSGEVRIAENGSDEFLPISEVHAEGHAQGMK